MPALRLSFCLFLLVLPTAAALAEQAAAPALVRLASTQDGTIRTGTGFVVATDEEAAFILTAAHVVSGSSEVIVDFTVDRSQSYVGKVLRNDPQEDLSLLRVLDPPEGIQHLVISPDRPSQSQQVTIAGFPLRSLELRFGTVTISSFEGTRLVLSVWIEPVLPGHHGQRLVGQYRIAPWPVR